MLHHLVHRLLRQARRLGKQRIEVGPPAMLSLSAPTPIGWRAGLRDWLGSGSLWPSGTEAAVAAMPAAGRHLELVRAEFSEALADIRTQEVGMLQGRLRIAGSLRELWHLRPEVFKLVALHFDQREAQCRLDRLNRHFPTRSPRSGFALLDAPQSDARPGRRN